MNSAKRKALIAFFSTVLLIISGCSSSSNNALESDADLHEPEETAAEEIDEQSTEIITELEQATEEEPIVEWNDEAAVEVETESSDDKNPPIFKDFRAAIEGEFASSFDLNTDDKTKMVPVTTISKWKVWGQDDVTAAKDLVVKIVNELSDEPIDQSATFRNGIWEIKLNISPGMTLYATVADAAGNMVKSAYKLKLQSLAESVAGAWEERRHNPDQTIAYAISITLTSDNNWSQNDPSVGGAQTGKYEITGSSFILNKYKTGGSNTFESRLVTPFYVDETYFTTSPFARVGAGTKIAGLWTLTQEIYAPDNDGIMRFSQTVTLDITLNEDGTLLKTETNQPPGDAPPTVNTEEGTWKVELNGSYVGNFGDFLVFKATKINGTAVENPADVYMLHKLRANYLLIRPAIKK